MDNICGQQVLKYDGKAHAWGSSLRGLPYLRPYLFLNCYGWLSPLLVSTANLHSLVFLIIILVLITSGLQRNHLFKLLSIWPRFWSDSLSEVARGTPIHKSFKWLVAQAGGARAWIGSIGDLIVTLATARGWPRGDFSQILTRQNNVPGEVLMLKVIHWHFRSSHLLGRAHILLMVFSPCRLNWRILRWRLHQNALTVCSERRAGVSRWSLRRNLILFVVARSLRTTPSLDLVFLHLLHTSLKWRKL